MKRCGCPLGQARPDDNTVRPLECHGIVVAVVSYIPKIAMFTFFEEKCVIIHSQLKETCGYSIINVNNVDAIVQRRPNVIRKQTEGASATRTTGQTM